MRVVVKLFGILGVALLVSGFSTERVKFKNVPLNSNDKGSLKTIPGFLTKPKGKGPFAAVVLLHACGGPKQLVTRFWPRYLSKLGYATLSPDSLKPRGRKICAGAGKQPMLGPFGRLELERDAYGALEYLSKRPFIDKNRIAVMGLSMGGGTIGSIQHRVELADRLSRSPRWSTYSTVQGKISSPSGIDFKAAISLYAACSISLSNRSPASSKRPLPGLPKIPWLIVMGTKETPHYISSCKEVSQRSNLVELHILKGAYHAFDNTKFKKVRLDPGGNKMLYSSKATRQSQKLIKAFLEKQLK